MLDLKETLKLVIYYERYPTHMIECVITEGFLKSSYEIPLGLPGLELGSINQMDDG